MLLLLLSYYINFDVGFLETRQRWILILYVYSNYYVYERFTVYKMKVVGGENVVGKNRIQYGYS